MAGFDDAPISRMAWPQLTTVSQPNVEMAAAAIDVLIGPGQARDKSFCIELPYAIVERASFGPAPRIKAAI